MPVGRPKGIPKTGGRRKGSQNRVTKATADKIAASGLTPLDFMLSVMRDEKANRAERLDAAKSAAPYVHPRLAAVEHTGGEGGPILFQKIERVIVNPSD